MFLARTKQLRRLSFLFSRILKVVVAFIRFKILFVRKYPNARTITADSLPLSSSTELFSNFSLSKIGLWLMLGVNRNSISDSRYNVSAYLFWNNSSGEVWVETTRVWCEYLTFDVIKTPTTESIIFVVVPSRGHTHIDYHFSRRFFLFCLLGVLIRLCRTRFIPHTIDSTSAYVLCAVEEQKTKHNNVQQEKKRRIIKREKK